MIFGAGETADVPETDFGDMVQHVDSAGETHNANVTGLAPAQEEPK